MSFIELNQKDNIVTLSLNRGKVNAINEEFVDELSATFHKLANNADVGAIILTGKGKFFSFGFDIPGFLDHSRDDFKRYLIKFTGLYTYLFLYPKPIIAAINGHAIAGGCMLTNTCDYRIMISGKAKISLNELSFGASVFDGSVAILKNLVGGNNAERVLLEASMFSAEQAKDLGLVDQVVYDEAELYDAAETKAREYASKNPAAYSSIKKLLRQPVVDSYRDREEKSIDEFLDIWYSESTQRNLREIKIRE